MIVLIVYVNYLINKGMQFSEYLNIFLGKIKLSFIV